MVEKKHLYIVAAVVIAGVILFFLFYETEEDKVKKQFTLISDSIEKQPGENPLVGAGKLKRLLTVLATPCQVDIPSKNISRPLTSRELTNYATVRRTRFIELSLTFHDVSVAFQQPDEARVSLTAILKGTLDTNEQIEDFHELDCSLAKTEDLWQINRIRVVAVLDK